MSMIIDTQNFESWLGKQTNLISKDLALKHEAMDSGVFPFFRATFYWWARHWPQECQDLAMAPQVLAVGDLHIENFGTWRDAEGRLAWGINDFDEASTQPYTNDLVRLATSASLAYEDAKLRARGSDLAEAFLDGYAKRLRRGGDPIVLADRQSRLEERIVRDLVRPWSFWEKLEDPDVGRRALPSDCRQALQLALPPATAGVKIRPRVAGKGSLGRPRFVAIGNWHGAKLAREAKAI